MLRTARAIPALGGLLLLGVAFTAAVVPWVAEDLAISLCLLMLGALAHALWGRVVGYGGFRA